MIGPLNSWPKLLPNKWDNVTAETIRHYPAWSFIEHLIITELAFSFSYSCSVSTDTTQVIKSTM